MREWWEVHHHNEENDKNENSHWLLAKTSQWENLQTPALNIKHHHHETITNKKHLWSVISTVTLTQDTKYKMKLILHCWSGEERSSSEHFIEYTTYTPAITQTHRILLKTSSIVINVFSEWFTLLLRCHWCVCVCVFVSPDVDGCGVFCWSQQHIRWSVPQRHHFIREGLRGNWLCTCKTYNRRTWVDESVSIFICLLTDYCVCTKVSQFQLSSLIDQKILRFQVSV